MAIVRRTHTANNNKPGPFSCVYKLNSIFTFQLFSNGKERAVKGFGIFSRPSLILNIKVLLPDRQAKAGAETKAKAGIIRTPDKVSRMWPRIFIISIVPSPWHRSTGSQLNNTIFFPLVISFNLFEFRTSFFLVR